jgi:cysteine-rich repeat protein
VQRNLVFIGVVALMTAACTTWEPARCPSGRLCPPDTTCAAAQDTCITTACGDGFLDTQVNEQCDDGNIIRGDGCDHRCAVEGCGNGVVDVDEVCEDSNVTSGDGCSDGCLSEFCGNNMVDEDFGETCDDGNKDSGDGCSAYCLREICGNGIVDRAKGESCDDANTQNGDGCSDVCASEYCGNGTQELFAGEMCDDGNTESGDGCSNTCLSENCGNGVVDTSIGETCDDGNATPGDNCSDVCQQEYCGNGTMDFDEACDDGNASPGDGCSDACHPEVCGNRIRDVKDECDDGNTESGDGCNADCGAEICGNNRIDSGEPCDDGNEVSGDGCSADCRSTEICGNGFIDSATGEFCDDERETEQCNADCTLAICGDAKRNATRGELCDEGGNTATCDADCTLARCGDGFLNTMLGEICDAGEQDTATCDGDCTPPGCGDGWWNPANGEQCDTAGNSSTCDQDCTQASCGDQFVNPVAGEVCDDGNLENDDECTAVCELADCTDGFQNEDESDVDCGGHCGSHSCEMLQSCSISEDCAVSGVCLGGTCVPDGRRLATGGAHTCALLDTGAVRCWGHGGNGRLGYGNTSYIGDNEAPASAGNVNVGGSVVQLAAGGSHTCALLDTGAVRCWGYGGDGRLGYGNTSHIGDNEAPASAGNVNVGGSVVQLAAGGSHTCALLDTGAVRCWGYGFYGQLGYGNTSTIGDDEAPASAGNVNVGGSVVQLAAGDSHTCALLDTGAVRCWGRGHYGRLGYGNTSHIGDNEAPASAGNVNVGGSVVQLTAGGSHTCALLDTGAVRCWGRGHYGRLGYGNTSHIGDNEAPASAGNVNVGGSVVQLAAGGSHTCALLDTGAVRCWGDGTSGQLGYGNTSTIGDNEVPASAGDINLGGTVVQLVAGVHHTCARLDTGAVRCWGRGHYGRLGYGNTSTIGDNETPSSAGNINIGGIVVQLAAGEYHTCALLDTGAVRCWGYGGWGQLGYGNTSNIGDNEAPASAGNVNVGGTVVQLATGGTHTCALLDTGAVRCWGNGLDGRLGYGNTSDIGNDEAPASAGNVNVGGTVVQLAAGYSHTCALLDAGTVRCWGYGGYGQLGYGNTSTIGDNEVPASAGNVNVGGAVVQLAAGYSHTCALLGTGAVRCWGDGVTGQLGYGNTNDIGDNEAPASAGNVNVGGTVVQVTASYSHTCALLDTGVVRCWGDGAYGQLGYGNTNDIGDNEVPASAGNVNVGGTVVQLAAGGYHNCALLNTSAVRCWGFGHYGQLGYGNTNDIGDNELPASAGDVDVGGYIIQSTAISEDTCSLLDTGDARCWGDGFSEQRDHSTTNTSGDDETSTSPERLHVDGPILPGAASFERMSILLGIDSTRCWSDKTLRLGGSWLPRLRSCFS